MTKAHGLFTTGERMDIDRFEEDLIDSIQAQRCRKLLWSVIELAVDDACKAPNRVNPTDDAITGMRFLMRDVDSYLHWLDVDGPEFRRRLVEAMYYEGINKFDDGAKRAFRYNHKWYLRNENHSNN